MATVSLTTNMPLLSFLPRITALENQGELPTSRRRSGSLCQGDWRRCPARMPFLDTHCESRVGSETSAATALNAPQHSCQPTLPLGIPALPQPCKVYWNLVILPQFDNSNRKPIWALLISLDKTFSELCFTANLFLPNTFFFPHCFLTTSYLSCQIGNKA